MKYVLYGHGTAYNHGAEAIVKTTVDIIRKYDSNAFIVLSTHFAEHDKEFGIHNIVDKLIEYDNLWLEQEKKAVENDKETYAKKMYEEALNEIDSNTVCLGIGGDNYCYPNWHRQAIFHKVAKERNAKSILWRCSINKTALTDELREILKEHDLIIARESATLSALNECGINNSILLPDTAFILKPLKMPLPEVFHSGKKVIGINVSPLILRYSEQENELLQQIMKMVNYILDNTDFSICLIPHVTVSVDNDINALSRIYSLVRNKDLDRVSFIEENSSASEYKYAISNCELMICSRTHASIAAYSSIVPTLVIGYSIKSIGIAKDLDLDEYVVDAKNIKDNILIDKFKQLVENSNEIQEKLKSIMINYKKQAEIRGF